ncbi:MAG: serine-type D-Ala-D-Ala carboxypeptidase [Sporanaerobacter sp.]|jgi:serine-type D-Ala-D-Ala carboxypeptidase (penicillin-binding protein 5/6)|uniref:D-alanyl-D-alanine carboxypeptidase family protein n=1 Tax=Sporanaerobacter sp. TaxID=2010183 RepID=UPI003A0FCB2C
MVIKKVIAIVLILVFISSYSFATVPEIKAESAILMDAKSGRILYSFNPHEKLPMASTTKIMTALIAIEEGDMEDIVEIGKESVGIEGSSIYLYENEKISLKDLLYGLMLRSGNDASVAIGNYIGGDLKKFINMMNDKAKDIGAINTSFVNPNGLDAENHYTTAYDLALITREALKHEKFKEIVKTKIYIANRDKNNYFYNKNKTLWQYEGGDGVKIGYTKRSGRCLVSSATREGMQIIAIVLNDGDWFNDCYKMLDYGFENYSSHIIYDIGQFVSNVKVINGELDFLPVVVDDLCVLPLKENEKEKIKISTKLPDEIQAPIKIGDKIGKISVYLDGELLYTSNLISKYEVKEISYFKRILKSLKN